VEQQLQCPVLEQARSPARRRSGGARSGFGRARAGCVCSRICMSAHIFYITWVCTHVHTPSIGARLLWPGTLGDRVPVGRGQHTRRGCLRSDPTQDGAECFDLLVGAILAHARAPASLEEPSAVPRCAALALQLADADVAEAAAMWCNDYLLGEGTSDGSSRGDEDKERPDTAAAVRRLAWTRAS
jgi:hypothetical protein